MKAVYEVQLNFLEYVQADSAKEALERLEALIREGRIKVKTRRAGPVRITLKPEDVW